ncbi:MAG: zinc-dependent alcohol dehydrogenase [Thermoguttaceae bacterium]
MQALVLTEYNRFEVQDRPAPRPADGEVLLRVAACGICGSDIHGVDGSTGRRQPPLVMGHEAAGTIAEVGRNVEGWNVGDRVTFDSTIYCGRCWFCRRGQINLCDHRRVLGVSCDEYRRDGAFAEYVAVPQRILYRLPDAVTFEQAAMVEPLSIALHAVHRAGIRLDDTAVVVGTGMIGLLVVQALRAAGCGQILGVDLDPRRLDLACRLGADAGLRADTTDVPGEVLRRTRNRGADAAFEVVGNSAALQTAAACLRRGGRLALVGNLVPEVEFPLQAAVTREWNVYGSCASCGEYPACLNLMARGTVDVRPLISAVAPLAEGAAWFRRLQAGEKGLMKVILQP